MDYLNTLWFQNKLQLVPEKSRLIRESDKVHYLVKFSQTLLLQFQTNFLVGLQLRHLTEKSYSLLAAYQGSRVLAYLNVAPKEKKLEHSLMYLSKIREIYGYKVEYDHRKAMGVPLNGLKASILHCYALEPQANSYVKT